MGRNRSFRMPARQSSPASILGITRSHPHERRALRPGRRRPHRRSSGRGLHIRASSLAFRQRQRLSAAAWKPLLVGWECRANRKFDRQRVGKSRPDSTAGERSAKMPRSAPIRSWRAQVVQSDTSPGLGVSEQTPPTCSPRSRYPSRLAASQRREKGNPRLAAARVTTWRSA